MFSFEILDVAVGLVLVYLVLALVCTAVNELLASLFNLRGKKLLLGVGNLLHALPSGPRASDRGRDIVAEDIYRHPLIKGLYRRRWPSYIPSAHFAQAVIDTLLPADGSAGRTVELLKAEALKLEDPGLRRVLVLLIGNAGDSLEQAQKNIESWFDQAMERVSGWYKRQTQWLTLVIALLLTAGTNADTIALGNRLSTDPTLREALVVQAKAYTERPLPDAQPPRDSGATAGAGGGAQDSILQAQARQVGARIQDLERLGLPLGWGSGPIRPLIDAPKILGLLITALAVSLGAPFWFDVLQKIMSVRAAGGAPGEIAKAGRSTPHASR